MVRAGYYTVGEMLPDLNLVVSRAISLMFQGVSNAAKGIFAFCGFLSSTAAFFLDELDFVAQETYIVVVSIYGFLRAMFQIYNGMLAFAKFSYKTTVFILDALSYAAQGIYKVGESIHGFLKAMPEIPSKNTHKQISSRSGRRRKKSQGSTLNDEKFRSRRPRF